MKQSEEIQQQSHLARVVASTLDIKTPNPVEIKFRGSLLRKAVAEIPTLKPNFLIRLYESACAVDFADEDVQLFRMALGRALAGHLDLVKYKATKPSPSN